MSVFEDITLGYGDEEYIVKSNQVMKLIAMVEEVITLRELSQDGGPRLTRLAEAYKVALNYAGANVTTEQVYASLFGNGGAQHVASVMQALIMMMLPPATYNQPEQKESKPKKKKRAAG